MQMHFFLPALHVAREWILNDCGFSKVGVGHQVEEDGFARVPRFHGDGYLGFGRDLG
jgi:hypothetical protein